MPRIKQDDENMEKLHCAARKGQTEHVRRLINGSGIDPEIQNKFGCTALHLACKYGQLGCVRELAGAVNPMIEWHGKRPLQLAVESGNREVISVMMDAIRAQNRDVAALINECDAFDQVIDHGRFGLPPMHVAGQTVLHYCVSTGNTPMLELLLSMGGSANSKDRNGQTVLMRSIELGAEDEFRILVTSPGVSVDATDKTLRTALHIALLSNRPEMARRLAEMGANVNASDQEGNTAITHAISGGFHVLLESFLVAADPFAIQSAPFHNGVSVLPERLVFYPFVTDDAVKAETVKSLQKKLDAMRAASGAADDGTPGKRRKKKTVQ